jgi:hypothetical protein
MAKCQACGIQVGGKYKISKFSLGLDIFKSGDITKDRLEQRLYSFDGLKLCGFCIKTLIERGYLIRYVHFTPPTYEIVLRDKTRIKCYPQNLDKKLREALCKLQS